MQESAAESSEIIGGYGCKHIQVIQS